MRARPELRVVPMLAAVAALGCASSSGSGKPNEACPSRVAQALVGATLDESYLGLSPAETRAVVEIIDGSGATDALCSGVAVAPGWVLSAAHCLQIESPAVRVQGALGAKPQLVAVKHGEPHPTLDLALFELDFSAMAGVSNLTDLGVAPIPAVASDLGLAVGEPVEIAGFGLTESQTRGELRFLVEALVAIDENNLHVDGYGMTGACLGDSGGPLLARASDGSLRVAGILSAGSPTCMDQDRYVRVDAAADWVEETVGPYASPQQECGSIGVEGRCLSGAALFCDAGVLQADDCAAAGAACGWDATQAGFRCVPLHTSACEEVDAVGACRGTAALTCVAGELVTTSCGACGACRPAGATGAPYCVSGD